MDNLKKLSILIWGLVISGSLLCWLQIYSALGAFMWLAGVIMQFILGITLIIKYRPSKKK